MADVDVAPKDGDAAGVDLGLTTLNASDTFKIANSGSMLLYLKETGASTATVTIATTLTAGGLSLSDQAVALTANDEKFVGPFPRSIYGNTLDVTCDGANVDLDAVDLA